MDQQLAEILDDKAIKWAFRLYWKRDFLHLAKIKELPQIEQDRIFNELIIAGQTVEIFALENAGNHDAEGDISRAHREYMRNLGVGKEHTDLWKKLLKMRYDEYSSSKNDARMAMLEFESKEHDFDSSRMSDINALLPPFNVAVGTHKHIVRSKTKGRDLLFKLIMKNLSRFYIEIIYLISGKKISPVNRTRMKLSHLINDIKEKFSS